jgi:hypothetical protein
MLRQSNGGEETTAEEESSDSHSPSKFLSFQHLKIFLLFYLNKLP